MNPAAERAGNWRKLFADTTEHIAEGHGLLDELRALNVPETYPRRVAISQGIADMESIRIEALERLQDMGEA